MGEVVTDYGAVGDGAADDTAAFEAALAAAAPGGRTVVVPTGQYLVRRTLVVQAGVTLRGTGIGGDPLQMLDQRGSVLIFARGDGGAAATYDGRYAVEVAGSGASVRDLAIRDANLGAGGGLLVNATARGIESATVFNVLLYNFAGDGAVALHLLARDAGAIAYCSFYDVRVRHGHTGILLEAPDDTGAFVNSNDFWHGVVSGGGFDYAVRLRGPGAVNNNVLYGTVIEPYESGSGHLVVEGAKSAVECRGVRVEGLTQPDAVPIVRFAPETAGSILDAIVAHGWVDASEQVHDLRGIVTGKTAPPAPAQENRLRNAALVGAPTPLSGGQADAGPPIVTVSGAQVIPWWNAGPASDGMRVHTPLDADVVPPATTGHRVLEVVVPPGVTGRLVPDAEALAAAMADTQAYAGASQWPAADDVAFAVLAWANATGAAFLTLTSTSGVTSSSPHAGDGRWRWIGMTTNSLRGGAGGLGALTPFPTIVLDAAGSPVDVVVRLCVPTLRVGRHAPSPTATVITAAGGALSGPLAHSLVEVDVPASGTFWVLPRTGNMFLVAEGASATIQRINHVNVDRFVKGTVVTLLFQSAGVTVSSSAYVELAGGAAFSSADGASLTLVAADAGTWREVGRGGV